MIRVESPGAAEAQEVCLFAFDDHAIPWADNLQLTMVQAQKHSGNPVLGCGGKGAPDSTHAIVYGSVIRTGGKFRMWYLGMFEEKWDSRTTGWWRPMCYAESEDGVTWTKPELGLVDFRGSRKNNICLIEPAASPLARVDDFLTVIHEPHDPEPERRYKAAYIVHIPQAEFSGIRPLAPTHRIICGMACATSPDGLRWRVVGERPAIDENFEVSGLYKFQGWYYATGQQITPWAWMPDGGECGRVMTVYRSGDFEQWSHAKALGFARPGQWAAGRRTGEQTHVGAGMWNKGNVLVGLYGMWQDGPTEIPKGESHLYGTRIDLGLIVSNDGVHFREPVPNFKTIARGKDGEWDSVGLTQAHAFENVGDKTYLWYGHWDCEGKGRPQEIGLATLRRDGFGYLSRRHKSLPGEFVTCPMRAGRSGCKVLMNVDGVSARCGLKVELLDERGRPVEGFSGEDAAAVTVSGTRVEVVWKGGQSVVELREAFAIRARFPSDGEVRVYAVYAVSV